VDAPTVVGVKRQVLLAHRTGERRDCDVVDACGLGDDRGGTDKWWRGHGRHQLNSLELEQKRLDQLSLRRQEVVNDLGDDCENLTLGAW